MISAEKISEMVRNPLLAGNATAAEILEVQQKFPYSSTLHLLYLKNLALSNDVQFEDRLRYAAAHIMDRERMFHLVHSEAPVADVAEPVEKVVRVEVSVTQIQESAKTDEIKQATPVEVEPVKEEITVVSAAENDELIEETILPTVATTVFEKELELGAKEDRAGAKSEETKQETETVGSKQLAGGSESLAELNTKRESVSETPVDLAKLSFVEWLRYKQAKPTETAREVDLSENQSTPVEPIKTSKTETTEPVITESADKKRKSLSKTDVNAILNKFITEEPSISRLKAEFYNPVKTAKQSLEETPDLVTETLAKIYVLQKNYTKAIQAYEQLSLVYPEKKAFFASQIEKIKDELPK